MEPAHQRTLSYISCLCQYQILLHNEDKYVHTTYLGLQHGVYSFGNSILSDLQSLNYKLNKSSTKSLGSVILELYKAVFPTLTWK